MDEFERVLGQKHIDSIKSKTNYIYALFKFGKDENLSNMLDEIIPLVS